VVDISHQSPGQHGRGGRHRRLLAFVVGVVNGQYFVAVLSLALVGCGAEFVRHSRFPARIDMDDAGNL
jgi:UDP-N-acetylmuramyl pentapeptide phosphotransferase/UDP-N-acetylglucosamine-1-phosphate transferase